MLKISLIFYLLHHIIKYILYEKNILIKKWKVLQELTKSTQAIKLVDKRKTCPKQGPLEEHEEVKKLTSYLRAFPSQHTIGSPVRGISNDERVVTIWGRCNQQVIPCSQDLERGT